VNILLFVAAFGGPQRAGHDAWFGRDKFLHFTASAVVQCATHSILRANGSDYGVASRGAALATLTVGIGKEVWDSRRGGDASWRDLAWDGAGGVAGAVTMRQIHR
jgi:putative lipoprotein